MKTLFCFSVAALLAMTLSATASAHNSELNVGVDVSVGGSGGGNAEAHASVGVGGASAGVGIGAGLGANAGHSPTNGFPDLSTLSSDPDARRQVVMAMEGQQMFSSDGVLLGTIERVHSFEGTWIAVTLNVASDLGIDARRVGYKVKPNDS